MGRTGICSHLAVWVGFTASPAFKVSRSLRGKAPTVPWQNGSASPLRPCSRFDVTIQRRDYLAWNRAWTRTSAEEPSWE